MCDFENQENGYSVAEGVECRKLYPLVYSFPFSEAEISSEMLPECFALERYVYSFNIGVKQGFYVQRKVLVAVLGLCGREAKNPGRVLLAKPSGVGKKSASYGFLPKWLLHF